MVAECWRYCLPCGHHNYTIRHTNPRDKYYHCQNPDCLKHFPKDALIDKKEEGSPNV